MRPCAFRHPNLGVCFFGERKKVFYTDITKKKGGWKRVKERAAESVNVVVGTMV